MYYLSSLSLNPAPKDWARLGSLKRGVSTRQQIWNYCEHHAFVSYSEPQQVQEALDDEDWLMAMHEELNNFERNQV